ncbi:MAG: hypothetical protein JO061_21065 [Acidobacteriaceae bacterium]|nr:hypothetical protein [Acidobacteriaceae bacterium]
MIRLKVPLLAAALLVPASLSFSQTAAEVADQLHHLSVNTTETYHVRDVHLRRGDVSVYLNEGVISFASAVSGRVIAAIFTTKGVDAGDAEIIILPPQAAERASLASFAKTPNVDEHFTSAVFYFSDNTRDDILKQVADPEASRDPQTGTQIAPAMDPVLQGASSQISTRLLRALLSSEQSQEGFFLGIVLGRRLGQFDFLYEPSAFEPLIVGAVATQNSVPRFQLWSAYRPRNAEPYTAPPPAISNYKINAQIADDLSLSAIGAFDWVAGPESGRVVSLSLSRRLRVASAEIDGSPAEVFQAYSPDFSGVDADEEFLVIAKEPFKPGKHYRISVQYSGLVIRQVSPQSYFVSERNVWYPHTTPMLTTFDLTFRCPARLQLVATGEPLSDEVKDGIRTVHRRTETPEQIAGFNLGQYDSLAVSSGPYRIECYADKSAAADMNGIPQQCKGIVENYSREWVQLPIHTLAVTPIPGYFGQGFPGLIYLSTTAYLPQQQRPLETRGMRGDTFFSDILLPHEIAHQWWGNLVTAASYRADWMMESMANYSALQLMERGKGPAALAPVLDAFSKDLNEEIDGRPVESFGPVDFGVRLLGTADERVWHAIVYEKGTWILHMLHERMGDDRFRSMQASILRQYAGKPITNEQFRIAASAFLPEGQPDKDLTGFFETWVYGTGVPAIHPNRGGSELEVSGVDEAFTADLPLRCKSKAGAEVTRWLRIVSGSNPIPASRETGACQLPLPSEYLYRLQ